MVDFVIKYKHLYRKYKTKNLILSGIAAFFAGAIFPQMYAEVGLANNNFLNALSTLSEQPSSESSSNTFFTLLAFV